MHTERTNTEHAISSWDNTKIFSTLHSEILGNIRIHRQKNPARKPDSSCYWQLRGTQFLTSAT